MAAAATLKIHFNGHNSVAIARIYTKFGWHRKTYVLETENPRWRPAAILKAHKSS